MATKGTHLSWISVSDLDRAIDFFTKKLGFSVDSHSAEYGWAELKGEEGTTVGLAVKSPESPIQPGQNACITLTVDSIEEEIANLKREKVEFVGELQVVEGHVKMQMFKDEDGNLLQLVELL